MLIAAAKRACGVCYVRTYTSHNPLSRVHAAYHVPVAKVHGLSDSRLRFVRALLSYTDDIYTDDHKSWQRQKYRGGSKERKMSTSFWQGLHFSIMNGLV
jgi:hypothetical protein